MRIIERPSPRALSAALLAVTVGILGFSPIALGASAQKDRVASEPVHSGVDPSSAGSTSDANANSVDPRAEAILKDLSKYNAGLRTIEFDVAALMTAESIKQRTEVPASYHVVLERPNHISIWSKSGRREGTIVSDGKTAGFYSSRLEAYMTIPAPHELPELFNEPEFTLVTRGWLSMALVNDIVSDDLYRSISRSATKISYVSEEEIDGVKCDRIHIELPKINSDIWVEKGDAPAIRRVMPDLSPVEVRVGDSGEDTTKIALVFNFENKKGNVPVKPEQFVLTPPAGTKQVASLVEPVKHPMEGQKAPDFTLSLLDGGQLQLSRLHNKIVVIDFWTTGASAGNLPDFAEMQSPLHKYGVEFYAINQKESPERVLKFLQDRGLDIPVGVDKDGSIADLYKVTGLPEMVVIGKDGLVKFVHTG
ncbi:MAG TPA: DUF2092 domain-containing protein, partial [Chroococcales cyanobacterium]